MLSDIEIARNAVPLKIARVAEKLGITAEELEPYGHYKAKLSDSLTARLSGKRDGRLILVTAINPTPAGEGKTTVSIGLAQGLNKIGKNAVLALREPSLGPVFGVKGGAAGGGYSQVIPMDDINLHFTGDFHAITSANNLLSALIDNHIQQGNALQVDIKRVEHVRCLDINDRELRHCIVGIGYGSRINGVPREEHFQITVASEIMAVLCLSENIADLKRRLGNMLVAYDLSGEPLYARDFKAVDSMAVLLKDALKPNLVQTLENTPAIVHGGPFANIAHGCNSVRATKLALKLGDYAVTEAGFGADLGAEKFFDIKCRYAGLKPACAVLVATVRALKYNGGVAKADLKTENLAALEKGAVNLGIHIENLLKYGVPVVVAVNRFTEDTEAEIDFIERFCGKYSVRSAVADVFARGGEGGRELAETVVSVTDGIVSRFKPLYDTALSVKEKIETVAREIYRAKVSYTAKALKDIEAAEKYGGNLPVCIAKTQYSLSDDPAKLGAYYGEHSAVGAVEVSVRGVRVSAGAGFVVAYMGDIMTMPGLPPVPAAEKITISDDGVIDGLF